MKKIAGILLIAVSLCAAAQEIQKIAVVDMEQLFQEYYKTKIVEANLKRQADIYKDYASKLVESMTKLQEEFKILRDSSQNIALTEAARESKRLAAQDKYKELSAKEIELRNYNREKQAQLRDERDRERARLLNEIKAIVKSQAVMGGYQIVLDKAGASINSFPLVVYSASEIDITLQILNEMNIGHTNDNKKQEDPK